MGAIVLQTQSAESGVVVKRIVVDGQQRLTTLQLLLKAAQDSFQSINDTKRAAQLTEFVQNRPDHQAGDTDNQTKVRQSNVNDLRSFQDVINGTVDVDGPLRPIGDAFRFFKIQMDTWLNDQPGARSEKAAVLKETLTDYLQLATVDLHKDEKPHLIFTVLNARAEPLKESDHIKNTIMYEANVIDDAERYQELWGPFDRNEWWRTQTKEGRLTRIHLDRFLNYWMVMSLGEEVSAERVSSEFSDYIGSSGLEIDGIAAAIRKAGQIYQDMEEIRQPGIKIFLARMKALELGVVMPSLLWLYTNDIPEEKRQRSIQALESYLVRRVLCGIGSQGLNRLFVELLSKLRDANVQDVDQCIIDFLKDQTVDNRIWPRDDLLRVSLTESKLRGNVRRKTMVLEALESHLRSSKTEVVAQAPLTLEHIMPKSWQRNWPLPTEAANDHDAIVERDRATELIGNLTLTSGKLNQSLSNSAWGQKREILGRHTSLRLNWELLDKAPEVWNEDAIRKRSEQLTVIVTEIWPFADKL